MSAQPEQLPRISFDRREAAKILGVSPDLIKKAKAAGQLKAKTTSVDKDGNPVGKDLYAFEDLKAWFDGLASS